jgi:AcrR family transcriptional regulator
MRTDEVDAARDCVMAVGVRRTTFSDVARRAGISRMTLYSRYPDLASLLQALMAREFGGIIESAEREAAGADPVRVRAVEALAVGAERWATNPLFLRIVEMDPELLMPYMTDRLGEAQRAVQDRLRRYVEEGQREGSIRAGDAGAMAATLELATRGIVLSARARDRGCGLAEALQELRIMADRYLQP